MFCENNPFESLKGIPKYIGSDILFSKDCSFSEKEIKNNCKLKGNLYKTKSL